MGFEVISHHAADAVLEGSPSRSGRAGPSSPPAWTIGTPATNRSRAPKRTSYVDAGADQLGLALDRVRQVAKRDKEARFTAFSVNGRPRLRHPLPDVRFRVMTRGGSPVR
jgi:hypothetical protein